MEYSITRTHDAHVSSADSVSSHTPKGKQILMVEDDTVLAKAVAEYLAFEGYDVQRATDGESAMELIRQSRPHLLLLDVMLPGRNGFELLHLLRSGGWTPAIILSAVSQKADRLRGLRLGAEDYITKPFDLDELSTRIAVVLRRFRPRVETLSLDDIFVDFRSMEATRGRSVIRLTHREFELLRYLAERADHVVHRDELLREVWGFPDAPLTRSVDHAIARLRRKIEPAGDGRQFIHTVHGDGYRFTSNRQFSFGS